MNQTPMTCNIEDGFCISASDDKIIASNQTIDPSVDIYYITDPLCSHCWALEPVWNRLNEQYGDNLNMQTIMGGLLEDWSDFSDPSNGIQSPEDVCKHWNEVSEQYRMPIDGSIWTNNPVNSSYPASRVYKVLQQSNHDLALAFLRNAREAVMVLGRNIANHDVLIQLIEELGIDGEETLAKANAELGEQLLNDDFALAQRFGVNTFPTMLFVKEGNIVTRLVGQRSFQTYVNAIEGVFPSKSTPKVRPTLAALLEKRKRLYSKEIEIMYDIPLNKVVSFIKTELSDDQYHCDEIHHEMFIEWK